MVGLILLDKGIMRAGQKVIVEEAFEGIITMKSHLSNLIQDLYQVLISEKEHLSVKML